MTMSFPSPGNRLSAIAVNIGASSSSNSNNSGGNGFRRARPLSLASPTAGASGSLSAGGSGTFGAGGSSGNNTGRRHEEELINAYEAEEERIINVLSRKLEQLREDKIDLENALEAESENHVNRLSRELGVLRQANRELEVQLERARGGSRPGSAQGTEDHRYGDEGPSDTRRRQNVNAHSSSSSSMMGSDPGNPSALLMLDALRRENEQLRGRLVDTEREFVRFKRLNEVYREELIECRGRLGLPVDNLIGLTSTDRDPFSQPTHLRSRSSSSSVSASFSPSASVSVPGMAAGSSSTRHPYYDYSNGNSNSNSNSNASSPSTSVFHAGSGSGGAMAMSYKPRFVSGERYPNGHGHGSSATSTSTHTRTRAQATAHSQARQTHGVPIPRPPSQIRRPPKHAHTHFADADGDVLDGDEDVDVDADEVLPPQASGASSTSQFFSPVGSTPSSVSAASSDSPYPFSPVTSSSAGADPASYVTDVTSPPSSGPFGMMGQMGLGNGQTNNGVGMGGMVMGGMGMSAYGVPQRGLSYPSVPPPSLSSSFGSPTVGFHGLPRGDRDRDVSLSPVEPLSRRGSNAGSGLGSRRGSNTWEREREPSAGPSGSTGGRRVVETGSLRRGSFDRGGGMPVGGRVAETGTLLGRNRAGSLGLNLNANFVQGHGAPSSSMPETVVEGDDAPNDTAGLEFELAEEAVKNIAGSEVPTTKSR